MNMMNMLAQFQQFKKNPMAMLSQRFNSPQNLSDPNDIVKHLVDSGQVSKDQINQFSQMASMLK